MRYEKKNNVSVSDNCFYIVFLDDEKIAVINAQNLRQTA